MRSFKGNCRYNDTNGNVNQNEVIDEFFTVQGAMYCRAECLSTNYDPFVCTAFRFVPLNYPHLAMCQLYKGGPYTHGDGDESACDTNGCGPPTCYIMPNGKTNVVFKNAEHIITNLELF